jgi:dTDP-4-amino-4,6-dideoxygalactose transaminase
VTVPFVDLTRIHDPLLPEFEAAFRSIVARSAFINGVEITEFEKAFAEWVGVDFCASMSSGTNAATIALRTVGVTERDRVIVPAMTFIATVEAVSWAGATPVLVDVDENGLLDLDLTEKELAAGAKFIMPVHLFGELVDPTRLRVLAANYGATVIEDACQAHGAIKSGIQAGCIGQAAAFSFYPAKNLGALGDGGALCTNDRKIYCRAKALREHGQTARNVFAYEGYNARLDTLQAAFLNIKLPHLAHYNDQRRAAASAYIKALTDIPGLKLQSSNVHSGHVYHLFVVLSQKRNLLIDAFKKNNIGFGMHYPVAINQMPCYRDKEWAARNFPQALRFATQGISLPIFPGINDTEIAAVIEITRAVHG